jgi:hypothetical protein
MATAFQRPYRGIWCGRGAEGLWCNDASARSSGFVAGWADADRNRPCQRPVGVGNRHVNGHLVRLGAEGSGGEAPAVDAFDAGDGRLAW